MRNKSSNNNVKAKDTKKLFFSGVLVLTVANLVVKVIGAFLKVPLQRILDDGGMGYYSVAYDIYVWFYTISTTGLPVAVSIMISSSRAKGNFEDAKKIFKVVYRIFFAIGLLGMILMMSLSRAFAGVYKLDEAWYGIMAIAPTLFFICLSSAYRGFFQGHQNMVPTAISEVIEALGKLTLGIIFALYAKNQGYPLYVVAAYTLAGLTIGAALGMVYLFITKLLFKEEEYNAALDVEPITGQVSSTRQIIKNLLIIGIPITVSSSVMSFTNVIDGMILSSRLQSIGHSAEAVSTMFGNYKTLAVTMFNLPPSLIYPITASIVPLLSSAVSGGKKKLIEDTMNSSLRICSIISLPCAFGLSALSYPILCIIFPESSAEMAAPLLSLLAPSIFFLSMLSVTNSFLQSHKFQYYPIISMVAGAVVKLITSYVLIGIPGIEMMGAPIGTFLCYMTTMLLNFYFVAKKIGYIPSIGKIFVKPFSAALICAIAAYAANYLVDISGIFGDASRITTILSVIVAAVVYLVALILLKALRKEDILLLPKGQKICKIMEKYRIVS